MIFLKLGFSTDLNGGSTQAGGFKSLLGRGEKDEDDSQHNLQPMRSIQSRRLFLEIYGPMHYLWMRYR